MFWRPCQSPYQQAHPLKQRQHETQEIRKRYPDRLPVICEPYGNDTPPVDKTKYLVPQDLSIAQLNYVIRKRLSLPPDKTLFFFAGNTIPCSTTSLTRIYDNFHHQDGFLYLTYATQNAFGRAFFQ